MTSSYIAQCYDLIYHIGTEEVLSDRQFGRVLRCLHEYVHEGIDPDYDRYVFSVREWRVLLKVVTRSQALLQEQVPDARQLRRRGAPYGNRNACKPLPAEASVGLSGELELELLQGQVADLQAQVAELTQAVGYWRDRAAFGRQATAETNQKQIGNKSKTIQNKPETNQKQFKTNDHVLNYDDHDHLFKNLKYDDHDHDHEGKILEKLINTAAKLKIFVYEPQMIAQKILNTGINRDWLLTQDYDFLEFVAYWLKNHYKYSKLDAENTRNLFCSPRIWNACKQVYPAWREKQEEKALTKQTKAIQENYPTTCPQCGGPMQKEKCPQCGGFFSYNDAKKTYSFEQGLPFTDVTYEHKTIWESLLDLKTPQTTVSTDHTATHAAPNSA